MAECRGSSPGNEDFISKEKRLNEIRRNSRSVKGFITRYILNTRTVTDGETLKRVAFGEKDKSKPHRTVILVGEKGVEKSTLINAMVNYILGVDSTDRIWCEIIETKKPQTDSQTSAVTVYDIYPAQSSCSLTIIELHGFGDAEVRREELNAAKGLLSLFKSKDGVDLIDAVCLVVPSNTVRITERQLNYLDDILCSFSSDVEENTVVFITHDKQKSTPAVKAIQDAKVPCAQTDKGQPVYFSFNTFHCENFHNEKILADYQASWDLLNTTMERFLTFVKESKVINTKQTEILLKSCKQLTSSIYNLKDRIALTEFEIEELEQAKEALQQLDKDKGDEDQFEYEVNEPYKGKIPLPYWWFIRTENATCCKICEENCHYPGCRWAILRSLCSVMSDAGKCTVCTRQCRYTDHFSEGKIYVVKTRKVKKTLENLKKKYKCGEIKTLVCMLQNEIIIKERQKIRLVDECYQCMFKLDEVASWRDYVSILQNINFLILKVKETGKAGQVQKLDVLKKKAEVKTQNRLGFFGFLRWFW